MNFGGIMPSDSRLGSGLGGMYQKGLRPEFRLVDLLGRHLAMRFSIASAVCILLWFTLPSKPDLPAGFAGFAP